jgi:DNA polymerase-3 subunit epsilon
MSRIAVIDFETTGISPAEGARPTEVAIVLVENGQFVDRYQSLMNPGVPIPFFIQQLTGITNAMVKAEPPVAKVMKEAADFVGNTPLLAHNAAFDSKFWQVELQKVRCKPRMDFACSLLLSRRLFPESPNHKLATLVQHLNLPQQGAFHRAMADAECTAHLLLRLQEQLKARYKIDTPTHEILVALQQASREGLEGCVRRFRSGGC